MKTLATLVLLTAAACTPTTTDSAAPTHSDVQLETSTSLEMAGPKPQGSSARAPALDVSVYGEKPCRFRVKFPAKPEVHSMPNASPILGPVKEHVARVKSEDVVFLTTCWDLTDADIGADKKGVEGAREDFVSSLNGSNAKVSVTTLDGHAGEEVSFQTAKLGPVRARFYLVDRRIYLVATAGPEGAVTTAFFDSFGFVD